MDQLRDAEVLFSSGVLGTGGRMHHVEAREVSRERDHVAVAGEGCVIPHATYDHPTVWDACFRPTRPLSPVRRGLLVRLYQMCRAPGLSAKRSRRAPVPLQPLGKCVCRVT